MANDSKRVSQLGITTTLATTDRVVVLKNPSSTPNTQTVTVNNFINSTINNFPYANTTQRGVTKIDGTSITTNGNGVISTASLTATANSNFYSEVAVDSPAGIHMITQTSDSTAWAVVYTQFASANNVRPNIVLTTRTAAGGQKDWVYDQSGILTLPANGDIRYANNASALGSLAASVLAINKPAIGTNTSVNTSNYTTNARILDTTKQIQYLISNGTSGEIHFYLPPGSNGQVMYFVAQTSQHMDDVYVWVDNVRKINISTLTSPAKWLPFSSTNNPRTVGTGIYIDGAWSFDTNDFN
jgi:hypothetical protein